MKNTLDIARNLQETRPENENKPDTMASTEYVDRAASKSTDLLESSLLSGDDNKGSDLVGFKQSGDSILSTVKDKLLQDTSILDYGATGVDDENIRPFLLKALNAGKTLIKVPNKTFSVDPNITMPGVTIEGPGRLISGNITGVQFKGISRTLDHNPKTIVPFKGPDNSMKIIEKRAGNLFYAITPNTNGYCELLFQDGVVTTTSSIGGPAELLRVVRVRHAMDVIVAYNTLFASTLTDLNVGPTSGATQIEKYITYGGHATATSHGNTASLLNYHRVNATGTITYQLPRGAPNANSRPSRKANIAFLTSTSSSEIVNIKINGLLHSTISLKTTENSIRIIELELPTSERSEDSGLMNSIVVENAGTGFAYVIAMNLYRLKQVPNKEVVIDFYRVYHSGVSYRENTGATDYAIFDKDIDKWCGSFHGGETSLSLDLKINGKTVDLSTTPTGTLFLAQSAHLYQKTNINDKLFSDISHELVYSGYNLNVKMKGPGIRCKNFYTMMSTTHTSFTSFKYPEHFTITADGDYPLGNVSKLIQYRPYDASIGAFRYEVDFTMFDNDYNTYGGARVASSSTYNKLYHGPVVDNECFISNITFGSVHLFD